MNIGGVAAVNEDPSEANMKLNPTNSNLYLEAPAMEALQSSAIVAVTCLIKKKRGRPRKYGPGGAGTAAALSPMPISSSIPLSGPADFSASGWKQHQTSTKFKPFQPTKKAHKLDIQAIGDPLTFLLGTDFTSHVITVNAGEDVAMKVLSLSPEGSRAICVLSANGSISNVTLRQPNSAGGTLTYEGRFEILSLSGSFMPTENGTLKSRSGGMSVSLAGPNGRVFGGGLAGLLIAANPVQVVVGSFVSGEQTGQKAKPPGMMDTQHIDDPLPALNSTQFSKDAETDNSPSSSSSSSLRGDSDGDSLSGFEIFG